VCLQSLVSHIILSKGKWLERINLAKAMLEEGLSIETVMKMTGLSPAGVLQ